MWRRSCSQAMTSMWDWERNSDILNSGSGEVTAVTCCGLQRRVGPQGGLEWKAWVSPYVPTKELRSLGPGTRVGVMASRPGPKVIGILWVVFMLGLSRFCSWQNDLSACLSLEREQKGQFSSHGYYRTVSWHSMEMRTWKAGLFPSLITSLPPQDIY